MSSPRSQTSRKLEGHLDLERLYQLANGLFKDGSGDGRGKKKGGSYGKNQNAFVGDLYEIGQVDSMAAGPILT